MLSQPKIMETNKLMFIRIFTFLASLFVLVISGVSAQEKILKIVEPFEVKAPDPVASGNVYLKTGIAETLIDNDENGNLLPALATSWSASEDGLEWHFQLRDDVVFHDGTKFDAAAAAKALNVVRTKPALLSSAPIGEIFDEGDVLVIRLNEPFAPLPAYLAEYRSLIYAPAAYGDDNSVLEVIGTGPYRLTHYEPPLSLAAVRFDDYWGKKPAIEKIDYQAVSRGETRALMAESGDADYVSTLDPASIARLQSVDNVEMTHVSVPRTMMLKLNAGHEFLSDIRMRQALSMAIDREGLAAAVLRYPASANQLFAPAVGEWHSKKIPPLAYDPDGARALLEEMGWQMGSDGIFARDGKKLTLTLTTFPDRPELPLAAAALQHMFAEIGVEMILDVTNASEIPVRHGDGTLEMALFSRNLALVPDPIGTLLTDYVASTDWGSMNWDNEEYVGLIRQLASGQGGEAERERAIEIMHQELPLIPVAWYQNSVGTSQRIKGAFNDPYERNIGLRDIEWVEN